LAKLIMGSETEYAIIVKGASDARPDNSAAYLLLKKCPYPFFSRSHLYGWRRRDGDFQIEAERMASSCRPGAFDGRRQRMVSRTF